MTLVVGVSCANAVILAAEQEEASGYTTKRFVKKLKLYAERDWSLAFAGAGDAPVIDNAEQRLSEWLVSKPTFSGRDLMREVDDILSTVHDRYIDKDPQPEGINLVIGASCSDGLFLIESSKRVPWFAERPACIGFGGEVASYLVNRLHDQNDDWRTTAKKIGLATEEAKKASRGCGGMVDFIVLQRPPDPTWRELGWSFYYEIETMIQGSAVADVLSKEIVRKFPAQFEKYGGYSDQHRPIPLEDDEKAAFKGHFPRFTKEQIDDIVERTRRHYEKQNEV